MIHPEEGRTAPRGGKANQVEGKAQHAFGSALETADEWTGNLAELAKDRPLTALMVAVSVGFVVRMLTHTRRT